MKPLGIKNYGSIGHLPGSRLGPGDHHVHEGQGLICTSKARDRHDLIIVQEKLDGSNVGVARIGDQILALSRSGYLASTSPYVQHHRFADWVALNEARFRSVLHEGERLVGEWLLQAHGTRYVLPHEPFVAFDLMRDKVRTPFEVFRDRVADKFVIPFTVSIGNPIGVGEALAALGLNGKHGAIDPVEGLIYRVERYEKRGDKREWAVDFLAKFVRHDKSDGCYLESVTNGEPIPNTFAFYALTGGASDLSLQPVQMETTA